jgi:uncharacterized membrane protein YdjX (TVP38/TMEM64 family)
MQSLQKRYRYDIYMAIILALLVVLLMSLRDNFGIFSDRDEFQMVIESYGMFGPVLIILTIVLEVIIAPLPGFVPAMTAGFVFGPVLGSLYTYIGNMAGSMAVFFLSRHFGKEIVMRFIDRSKLERYSRIIAKRETLLLCLYVLPFLPLDIITGAFGLSNIKARRFFVAIAIAFLGHVTMLNYFGDYLAGLYF